jgi:hypothetical protein
LELTSSGASLSTTNRFLESRHMITFRMILCYNKDNQRVYHCAVKSIVPNRVFRDGVGRVTKNWQFMNEMLHVLRQRLVIAMVAVAIGNITNGADQLPQTIAFPGAVGQGATAAGGRGGDIYHVTNLSDYNEDKGENKIPGSLRHAILSADGPRTIVFDVGGAIKLHRKLRIQNSKLTIAGQTAPGGITVWGYPVNISQASDVVIRYVRVRTGDFNARARRTKRSSGSSASGRGGEDLDASVANGVDVLRCDRIIVDHVSAAWGMDETLSVTHSRNVTVQHTIIAESLNNSFHPKGPHGYGTLIRGELTAADQEAGAGGYTFYNNLWALHLARNPSIGGQQTLAPGQPERQRLRADVNLVNNVIYGWGDQPTHRSEFGEVRINLVGNYYINGPAKKSDYIFREANAGRTLLYEQDNMLDSDQDADHNGAPVGYADDMQRTFRQFDSSDKLLGPAHAVPFNFFASVGERVLSADEAYAHVVKQAGASLTRDAIDTQVIGCVVHRTGLLIDSQEAFRDPKGHLPGIDDLPMQRRPDNFDTDRDGMPDEFERLHGLDPHDPADRKGAELSNDGYTNVEVYLNGLVEERGPR